jgi:hypothetical protein
MHTTRATRYAGKEIRFYRWNQTSTTGNKVSALISLVPHLIRQPSVDISPIWTHFMKEEATQLQLRPV